MNLDEYLKKSISRRRFLGSSALSAAGMVSLGTVAARADGPNDRLSLAVIGVRGHGKALAAGFAKFPDCRVASLCDVDDAVVPAALKAVAEHQPAPPAVERDFRRILDDRSIDAVVVATPDHWHAAMTVLACQAGKDVYVETPVSHTLGEGVRMVDAARKHGRIVQAGLQQRSGPHFQSAIELLRSGRLGSVKLAKAWTVHKRKPIGLKADSLPPPGVDYDLWLGPTPERPFNANRFHYNWHWFWDYGSGELGNWGVHLLDVARWGLGVELPRRVSSSGGRLHFRDDQQTPDTQFVTFEYADATITWEHCLWSNHGPDGRSAAVAFYGEHGTLIVDRGGWKVYDLSETLAAGPSEQAAAHQRNFLDCVKSRATPTSDIQTGHVSSALCHLGNIAHRLARPLEFDAAKLDFSGDTEANALLMRESREGWILPQA